jgi:hypothetical protein
MIMPASRLSLRAALVPAIIALAAPLAGQSPLPRGDAPYDSAYFAWEAGDYPAALARLDRLLSGPRAEQTRVPAALLTGELYRTTELTSDGRMVRWSPDSRFVAYQTGTGAAIATHVVRVDAASPVEVASVTGSRAAFGAGRVAYVQPGTGIVVRDLATGEEQRIAGVEPSALYYSTGGVLHYVATVDGTAQIHRVEGGRGTAITSGPGTKANVMWLANGTLLYGIDGQTFAVMANGSAPATITGTSPTVSADRTAYAYITRDGTRYGIVVSRADGTKTYEVSTSYALADPRLSPDGARLVFQGMPREDWELYTAEAGGPPAGTRLTHDIMHDIMPQFISSSRILAPGGEGRHRRSFIYDLASGDRTRLFHNNTIRTVAPEYEWAVSPDGTRVLIVAERDGDTVSPERGVYLVDLTHEVTVAEVLARVRAQRTAENDLRARGRAMFAPVKTRVAAAVADVSKDRIYSYASDLFAFDSKYITQPGNAKAIEYIAAKLRSWGYEPELQYFEARPRNGQPTRTANIVARLRGTMDQDATYVVSSHFDSVLGGAGADDDTSGTTALLEAARVLAHRPQPRTIEFAFFTGEEAGLLGSREFVRRAVADKKQIIGALNNDMIGFANDQRIDNTIRYSNPGIRDMQHGAAIEFTNLITYDAKYYKSTDAQAYYDAYGDIVGGIGSYPILSSPHYHQSHDVLETIDQQQVAEVSKTTVATLMLLSTMPSRPSGVAVERRGTASHVTWTIAPESDVRSYHIEWGKPGSAPQGTLRVTGRSTTSADIPGIGEGVEIRIKSVNASGMEAWDWARIAAK